MFLPRYTNSDDDFIMASFRMKQSKCFIESDGGMSCLDCNPHISLKTQIS